MLNIALQTNFNILSVVSYVTFVLLLFVAMPPSFGAFGCFHLYSITSMARTQMARLPWIIRTLFSVPTKSFKQLKKTNI